MDLRAEQLGVEEFILLTLKLSKPVKEFAEFELTTEFRDRFQQALNERDGAFIYASLEDVNPADITAVAL